MRNQMQTRWGIVSALNSLMNETPIDKIKVAHLCKRAGVSRTTFYDYFDNIYNVATWAWDRILDDSLYHIGTTYTLSAAHEQFFEKILEGKRFYIRAFRSHDYNSIMHYGYRAMAEWYLHQIPEKLNRDLTEEERMVISLFTAGAAHHTASWVQGGMNETPRFMACSFAAAAPSIFDCLQ